MSPMSKAVRTTRCRFCCCMAFPTIRAASTRSSPSSTPRASAPSFRICAAMAARGSCPRRRCVPANRPRWGRTCMELLDALRIEKAVLAGYDWGGRAACVVSALWPERVAGLVSCAGYNIQDIPNSVQACRSRAEARLWYQYYFHTERGRNGLTQKRRAIVPLAVEDVVADLGVRRRDVRANGCVVRQRGLCRCRHPFLSASLRQRRRRSALCVDRSAVGRAAEDRRSRPSFFTAPMMA